MQGPLRPFVALTGVHMSALLQLRSEVFVVEQNCVFQDLDGKDAAAIQPRGANRTRWPRHTWRTGWP